jgi:DNA-binding response OmpR family regulator/two-component sensor histidine kinase
MHTILIIDDEEPFRRTLAERLTLEGFRVQTAADGGAGLRQIREAAPDLVLCDIGMPGLDGYFVLRALQADARTATIPFIFLTAQTEPLQVRVAMGVGADDYLCKPVSRSELMVSIRARLRKHDQQQERLEGDVKAARQGVVRKLPHELLHPLTGLLHTSELLETAAAAMPLEAVRSLGRLIRLDAQRMQRTLRRFLLYAELAGASRQLEALARLRGTEYVPAAAWVCALAQHIAQRDSRSEDLGLELGDVEVCMAATHWSVLVAQLVDNAFKYSGAGKAVQIHLALPPGGGGVLSVRDHGCGMTPDQIGQVGAFRQFDADLCAQPGTGLGLALAGQIAALYDGAFTVVSEPGAGTTVTVRLPHARAGTQGVRPLAPELLDKADWTLGNR